MKVPILFHIKHNLQEKKSAWISTTLLWNCFLSKSDKFKILDYEMKNLDFFVFDSTNRISLESHSNKA